MNIRTSRSYHRPVVVTLARDGVTGKNSSANSLSDSDQVVFSSPSSEAVKPARKPLLKRIWDYVQIFGLGLGAVAAPFNVSAAVAAGAAQERPKADAKENNKVSYDKKDVVEMTNLEALPAEKQVAGWADWGLKNPERLGLALDRLHSFRVGNGEDDSWDEVKNSNSIRSTISWANRNFSEDAATKTAQQKGLATVLAVTGSESPTKESVSAASERLLRLGFGQSSEMNGKTLDFGVKTIKRLVSRSNNKELRGVFFDNALEMGGNSEPDPFKTLVGLAAK